jgi:hypothetical protein
LITEAFAGFKAVLGKRGILNESSFIHYELDEAEHAHREVIEASPDMPDINIPAPTEEVFLILKRHVPRKTYMPSAYHGPTGSTQSDTEPCSYV